MLGKIVIDKNPKNKFLEDYLTIFPDLDKNFSKETKNPAFSDKMIRKFITENSLQLKTPRIIEKVG
jgi:hypothetical protein